MVMEERPKNILGKNYNMVPLIGCPQKVAR